METFLKRSNLQAILGRIPRRFLALASVAIFAILILLAHSLSLLALPPLPSITIHYPAASPFNASKVALLIENRPLALLAPLTLHMISVVPPDWKFRFMGSAESVASLNASRAVRHQVAAGKLDLTLIPENMTTGGQEEISVFLTTLWIYETVLKPAEWLLVWQTDSILCANSRASLNDWLDYDWVGAPWSPTSRYGGNGGLSLRRVSAIVPILRQQIRQPRTEPEDVWLSTRLGHRPGARVANGSVSMAFSGENFYKEHPMGYHTGGGGRFLGGGIWGTKELRDDVYGWCPEIKMELEMDLESEMEGGCKARW